MLGETVSHYQVLEKLGEGGMGVVYKAADLHLNGRVVALKVLPPSVATDPDRRVRFEREAWAASRLNHPNVATIYEIGETGNGRLFIAMAFYDGETLEERLRRGALPVPEAVDVARQLAEGLQAAHEEGVWHRDVKPANVLLTKGERVVLIDFGIAKLKGTVDVTSPGVVMGSLPYMSPEQIRQDGVDHRTDVWSLGVVLHEMLAGRRPFEDAYDLGRKYRIGNEPQTHLHEVRPDVPAWVEGVVDRCLEKRPESRFGSMGEVLAALDEAARLDPPPVLPPRRTRRLTWLVPLLGLIVLAMLAVWAVRGARPSDLIGTSDPKAYALYLEGQEDLKEYMDPVRVDAAADALVRAVDRDSTFAAAHAALGESYLRKYQHTGDSAWVNLAREHTRHALRLDPRSSGAYVSLGLMDLVEGRARESLGEFRRAQGLNSTSAAVWRGIGDAYKALGDTRAAEHAFRKAIALDSTYWVGYNKLGSLLFSSGDYEGAAREFERLLVLEAENVHGLNNLGAALMALERYSEAEDVFLHLVTVHPNAWAHTNLGTIYFYETGDHERAADHYERALQYQPGAYSILGNLAQAYAQLPGYAQRSQETFRRAAEALEAEPGWSEDPLRLSELALYYASVGEAQRAELLVEDALSPRPEQVDVMVNAASTFVQLGDSLRAAEWLCEAIGGGYAPRRIAKIPELSPIAAKPVFTSSCLLPGEEP